MSAGRPYRRRVYRAAEQFALRLCRPCRQGGCSCSLRKTDGCDRARMPAHDPSGRPGRYQADGCLPSAFRRREHEYGGAGSIGKLGNLRLFNSVFTMQVREGNIRVEAELGGGSLYDIGVYCINAARYVFQANPTKVGACTVKGTDRRFREVDEMATAWLEFPGNRLATFVCSFGAADVSAY